MNEREDETCEGVRETHQHKSMKAGTESIVEESSERDFTDKFTRRGRWMVVVRDSTLVVIVSQFI